MTNNIPYASSNLLNKVCKIAQHKYKCVFEDVGLIMMQHQKKVYKKYGKEVATDVIDFVLFDNDMHKIGVVKREEIKKFKLKKKANNAN